jgi:isopentenyl-diphosphate Delta-isomerase
MPEYLEIFDEYNQSLQCTKLRRLVHEEGNWHRTAQVYVVNEQNELLCNLRSPLKDVFPLLWDVSFGGHLEPGESYAACAQRELAEELGILVEPSAIYFVTQIKIDGKDEIAQLIDREHAAIFVYKTTLPPNAFNYQREEIVELRYFPLATIKGNLRSTTPEVPFIPLQKQFLETIAIIERYLGTQG